MMKLGWTPSSRSLSVGSLHKISTTSCYSGVETSWMTSRGLWIFAIWSIETRVLPIPPCKHTILSSMTVASGSQSKSSLIFEKTLSGSTGSSPSRLEHSSAKPKELYHLQSIKGAACMSCSKRWSYSRHIKLLPLVWNDTKWVGASSDHILACVSRWLLQTW